MLFYYTTDGVDYTGVSVDVVFPAGSSQGNQVSFNISIIDDQLVEGDETILLQASTDKPGEAPSQAPGQDRATVVIQDNDRKIAICYFKVSLDTNLCVFRSHHL